MVRILGLTLALLAVALVGATTAYAAPGGGASSSGEVINTERCTSDGDRTVCFSTHRNWRTTSTPSGNTLTHLNTRIEASVFESGELQFTRVTRHNSTLHRVDGEVHVRRLGEIRLNVSPSGERFVRCSREFTFANGEVRMVDIDCRF